MINEDSDDSGTRSPYFRLSDESPDAVQPRAFGSTHHNSDNAVSVLIAGADHNTHAHCAPSQSELGTRPKATNAANMADELQSILDGGTTLNDVDGGRLSSEVYNLDEFLTRCYTYYAEHGFAAIVAKTVAHVCISLFSIGFFMFLTLYIDWPMLLACGASGGNNDSVHGTNVCSNRAFFNWPPEFTIGVRFVLVSGVLFGIRWFATAFVGARTIWQARATRRFYANHLGIDDQQLQMLTWNQVVDRIVSRQRDGLLEQIRKPLTHLTIANRIMRADNYFVALVNSDKDPLGLNVAYNVPFSFALPFFTERRRSDKECQGTSSTLRRSWLLTEPLCSNLQTCLAPLIATRSSSGSEQIDATTTMGSLDSLENRFVLQRKFVCMGLVNVVLSPFVLVHTFMMFFFRNTEEFYTERTVLGPRKWSVYAQWRLRQFNEMPHFAERRLDAAARQTQLFLDEYPNHVLTHFCRFLAYVAGAFVAVLLVFTVTDSSLLVSVRVFGCSLLWYLAIFSSVVALCRTCLTQPPVRVRYGHSSVQATNAGANVAKPILLQKHQRSSGSSSVEEPLDRAERLFQRVCDLTHLQPNRHRLSSMSAERKDDDVTKIDYASDVLVDMDPNETDEQVRDSQMSALLLPKSRPNAARSISVCVSDTNNLSVSQYADDAYWRHVALRDELSVLFPYKLVDLALEIIGVVVAPWVLLCYLPGRAAQICEFLSHTSIESDAIGRVCRPALFETANAIATCRNADIKSCTDRSTGHRNHATTSAWGVQMRQRPSAPTTFSADIGVGVDIDVDESRHDIETVHRRSNNNLGADVGLEQLHGGDHGLHSKLANSVHQFSTDQPNWRMLAVAKEFARASDNLIDTGKSAQHARVEAMPFDDGPSLLSSTLATQLIPQNVAATTFPIFEEPQEQEREAQELEHARKQEQVQTRSDETDSVLLKSVADIMTTTRTHTHSYTRDGDDREQFDNGTVPGSGLGIVSSMSVSGSGFGQRDALYL